MYIDLESIPGSIALYIVITVAFADAVVIIICRPVRLRLLGNGHEITAVIIPGLAHLS